MLKTRLLRVFLALVYLLQNGLGGLAWAQYRPAAASAPAGTVPPGINYQGRLINNGFPVSGTEAMDFQLYDAPTGGNLLWDSGLVNVTVAQGIFGTTLNISTQALAGASQKYLQVTAGSTVLRPREPLQSVPYALVAKALEENLTISSVTVGSQLISSGTLSVSVLTGIGSAGVTVASPMFFTSGNVGIGTTNPAYTLHTAGNEYVSGLQITGGTMTVQGNAFSVGGSTLAVANGDVGIDSATPTDLLTIGSNGQPNKGLTIQGGGSLLHLYNTDNTSALAINTWSGGGGARFYESETGGPPWNNPMNFLNGNVGIGTASPAAKLHVSSGTILVDGNAATGLQVFGSTLVVNFNGNVGVGTTNPGVPLDVVGPIRSSALNTANGAVYADSTGKLQVSPAGAGGLTQCLVSTNGGPPTFSACAGSVGSAWSTLSNPSANMSLSMGADLSTFTWNDNSTNNLFTLADTAGNTGTGYLWNVATANASSRNPLRVSANGANSLIVNSAGNVGIGTASPRGLLYIKGGNMNVVDVGDGVTLRGLSAQRPAENTGGGNLISVNNWQEDIGGSDGIGYMPIRFFTAASGPQMYLNTNGNLGIGTTSPSSLLHVHSTSAPPLYLSGIVPGVELGNNAVKTSATQYGAFGMATGVNNYVTGSAVGDVVMTVDSGNLLFGTGATPTSAAAEKMRITNVGNVGIGTTNPQSLLHLDNGGAVTATIGGYNTAAKSIALRQYGTGGAGNLSNETFTIGANQNVFSFTKPDSSGADLTRFEADNVGSLNSLNPFWSGFHFSSPLITVAGVNNFPRTSLYYSYTSAADPTDLTFNMTTGNTTAKTALSLASGNNGNILLQPGSGNVGIGTTSPGDILDILQNLDGAAEMRITNITNSANAAASLRVVGQNQRVNLYSTSDLFSRPYPGFHPSAAIFRGDASNGLNIISDLGTGAAGANTGTIRFITSNGDITSNVSGNDSLTRMTILNSGNVGIGTTGPVSNLTVSPNNAMRFINGGLAFPSLSVGAYGSNPTDGIGLFAHDTLTGYIGWIGAIRSGNENCANFGCKTLRFQVPDGAGNVTNALSILGGSGNVGIGTTSPGNPLEVDGNANNLYAAKVLQAGGTSGGGISSGLYVQTANTTANSGEDSVLRLASNGGANPIATFKNNGNVGIGTVNPGSLLTLSTTLNENKLFVGYYGNGYGIGAVFQPQADNAKAAQFLNAAGSEVGSIQTSASATTYNTSSDRRLKENITPTDLGLGALMKISVKNFNFISDPDKTRVQGLIAQDLYSVYPEAVHAGGANPKINPWTVDYGRLSPLIIESVQQLQIQIQELKTQNNEQQVEIEALRAELHELKKH